MTKEKEEYYTQKELMKLSGDYTKLKDNFMDFFLNNEDFSKIFFEDNMSKSNNYTEHAFDFLDKLDTFIIDNYLDDEDITDEELDEYERNKDESTKKDANLLSLKIESILSLLRNEKFTMEDEDDIKNFFKELEIERLDSLEKFIKEIINRIIDNSNLSEIIIYRYSSCGSIDDFYLDFVFTDGINYSNNILVNKIMEFKREGNEGILWFVNIIMTQK